MQIHYFSISVFEPEPAATALNELLAVHPNAIVEQYLVGANVDAHRAVSVRVPVSSTGRPPGKQQRVDYRELLSDGAFSRFATLREFRNKLAAQKGIKPYAIFTNQQLADMAGLPVLDRASIASINGVGKTRVEEYSDQFIALFETGSEDTGVD